MKRKCLYLSVFAVACAGENQPAIPSAQDSIGKPVVTPCFRVAKMGEIVPPSSGDGAYSFDIPKVLALTPDTVGLDPTYHYVGLPSPNNVEAAVAVWRQYGDSVFVLWKRGPSSFRMMLDVTPDSLSGRGGTLETSTLKGSIREGRLVLRAVQCDESMVINRQVNRVWEESVRFLDSL